MKKVVHFEVHFVILYSKTELLKIMHELLFFSMRNQRDREIDEEASS